MKKSQISAAILFLVLMCFSCQPGIVNKEPLIEYPVLIANLTGGTIEAIPLNAAPGTAVTLIITPDRGNQMTTDSLNITDNDGNPIIFNKIKNELYRFVLPSVPVTISTEFEALYKIGDIGPGGGTVFYDRGSYLETEIDSWRYMELSPSKVIIGGFQLTNFFPTSSEIGKGKENTQACYAVNDGNPKNLFVMCHDYRGGGYDDWFIPSSEEFILAMLSQKFNDDNYHWNSTIHYEESSYFTLLLTLKPEDLYLRIQRFLPVAYTTGADLRFGRRF